MRGILKIKKVPSTQKYVLETNHTIRGATQIGFIKAHFSYTNIYATRNNGCGFRQPLQKTIVRGRPQKSIQLSALYRTRTNGGSLKYCLESLLFFFNGFIFSFKQYINTSVWICQLLIYKSQKLPRCLSVHKSRMDGRGDSLVFPLKQQNVSHGHPSLDKYFFPGTQGLISHHTR